MQLTIIEQLAAREAIARITEVAPMCDCAHGLLVSAMDHIDEAVALSDPKSPEDRTAILRHLQSMMAEDEAEPVYRQMLAAALR